MYKSKVGTVCGNQKAFLWCNTWQVLCKTWMEEEWRWQSSFLFSWSMMLFCPSVPTAPVITLLWTTAANGKHGTLKSSVTATVLLQLFTDLVPHHSGVALQLVQLHELLLHPLLVVPELFLQFCNHKFSLASNRRHFGTFRILSTESFFNNLFFYFCPYCLIIKKMLIAQCVAV